MGLTGVLLWLFIFLVTQNVNSNPVDQDEATLPSTETNTVNTIDVLQSQLNQILVQFCASEIDRNRTGSAILKFGQLANSKTSIKNVVEFYIENYEESFDNLLHFINHIPSLELQKIAYNTLIDTIKLNQISVINLLSFEQFIRSKLELFGEDQIIEGTFYENVLLALGNHIKELIVSTNLNRLITFLNNTNNPDRIFELIPNIVQGIDLNNFTDMDRIFEFSMQLPKKNQFKLITKVLSEMRVKTQYKHFFHVIGQIRKLRDKVNELTAEEKCLLSALENLVPAELQQLLSSESRWKIKYYDSGEFEPEYLSFSNSPKYSKNLLFVASSRLSNGWLFHSQIYNSVWISRYSGYTNEYLSVEYCFHNDSFPTVKENDSSDLAQGNWYILMSDDLSYIQIKNTFTNELLMADADYIGEHGKRLRVALSAQCSECDASKWSLQLESGSYSNSYSGCRNLLSGIYHDHILI